MEALNGNRKTALWIAFALVLLIRIPFLNQAIQGDDHIYITQAQHALIDPLHPNNVKYVFTGAEVDLRGHPHPPANAWALAGLLVLFGDVREVPFHAAYIAFSLAAVWAAWSLACRFGGRPLWAVLLFIAVPAFVVNGASLESDLPFLAFWLVSIAMFTMEPRPSGSGGVGSGGPRLLTRAAPFLAVAAMAAACMTAYQGIFLIPILGVYTWIFDRRNRTRWFVLLTPMATIAAWQIFSRITTGTLPAAKLAGYLGPLLARLWRGDVMLLIHLWFILFPALLIPTFLRAWRNRRDPNVLFLLLWIAIFLCCGFTLFFAGSARYLLPIAAPLAILASRMPAKWLAPAFAAQLAIGLGMTAANYQHWDGYRQFAEQIRAASAGHRVWVDNDWGLRYYLEADHAVAARKGQTVRPGDIVVTSELGHNVEFTAPMVPIAQAVIQPSVPFRLIGLETESGYSTVAFGFWPFGISTGVVDRVHARMVAERHPTLEYVTTNAPEAREQIVSGVFPSDRWMSQSAVVALKSPGVPKKLRAEIYVPPSAPARRITLLLDGSEVASKAVPGEGAHSIESAEPLRGSTVEVRVDRTFRAPGDERDLGVVLLGVGFVQ